jgi:hypothetical protein
MPSVSVYIANATVRFETAGLNERQVLVALAHGDPVLLRSPLLTVEGDAFMIEEQPTTEGDTPPPQIDALETEVSPGFERVPLSTRDLLGGVALVGLIFVVGVWAVFHPPG